MVTCDDDGARAGLLRLRSWCGLLVQERLLSRQQPWSNPCIALRTTLVS